MMAKGEFLSLTGREDVWDGHRWLWAVADDGREGWVQQLQKYEGGHNHINASRLYDFSQR